MAGLQHESHTLLMLCFNSVTSKSATKESNFSGSIKSENSGPFLGQLCENREIEL